MNTIREEFEKWVMAQCFECKDPTLTVDGVQNADGAPIYSYNVVQSAWKAWRASRDALMFDVESLPSASYTDDGVVYRSHVEQMIESLGVAIK